MINKFKIKAETMLYLFFMIQPLVGIYRTFFDDNIKIFGFSFFEMLNTFFILGFFVYVFIKMKNKKSVFWLIGYGAILGIYCILHSYNMSKFNTDLMERDMYGLIKESYYIFRVYGLPIILLFSCIAAKFEKKVYIKLICDVAFLICLVIVVTNLLGLSLCTYKTEFHEYMIQGNLFDWFSITGKEEMDYFTSIGWFESGNEISGLLMISLPIVIYEGMTKRKWLNTIRVGVCMLAMLMIGTKTSVFGSFAVYLVIGIMMIIHFILTKDTMAAKKITTSFLCGVAIWGGLFYYSPFFEDMHPHRAAVTSESKAEEELEEAEKKKVTAQVQLSDATEENRKIAISYIENSFWNHYINEQYIQMYPIENDLSYWINVVNRDPSTNINYRFYKTELANRILERNNRSLDKVFGIGVLQEMNTEQDYTYQYFMFGIAGIILFIGIYIAIFIRGSISFLTRKELRWNVEFMSYLCALAISLLLPYVTGHMFGITMIMFEMAAVCTLIWRCMERNRI